MAGIAAVLTAEGTVRPGRAGSAVALGDHIGSNEAFTGHPRRPLFYTPRNIPSAMAIDVQDAALGAVVGLAVGDALGAPVEFLKPGSFPPITAYREGGILNLPSGCWTEDTALALCLAESLIACGEVDPADQLRRYVRYWREGYQAPTGVCLDIGTTTRRSLEAFLRTEATEAAPVAGLIPGNGSLVRAAPVAIFFAGDPERTVAEAAAMSRTTHSSPESVDACRYFAGLLSGAILGSPVASLAAPMFDPGDGVWDGAPLCRSIATVVGGSFLERDPPAVRAGGGAVQCLEAALWAFARGRSFREVVLAAVNLGDDADTVGAVAGQLAGACYGLSGIPTDWQEGLYRSRDVVRAAVNLMAAGTRAAFGLGPARPERASARRRTRFVRRVTRIGPGAGGDAHAETRLRFALTLPTRRRATTCSRPGSTPFSLIFPSGRGRPTWAPGAGRRRWSLPAPAPA
jgi:ADP-ribosylglycohydrolase